MAFRDVTSFYNNGFANPLLPVSPGTPFKRAMDAIFATPMSSPEKENMEPDDPPAHEWSKTLLAFDPELPSYKEIEFDPSEFLASPPKQVDTPKQVGNQDDMDWEDTEQADNEMIVDQYADSQSQVEKKRSHRVVKAAVGKFHRRSSRNRANHHRALSQRKHQRVPDRVSLRQLRDDRSLQQPDREHAATQENMVADIDESQEDSSTEVKSNAVRKMCCDWRDRGTERSMFDFVSFAKLSSEEQLQFLRRSERLHLLNTNRGVKYNEDYIQTLRESLATGGLKASVYTSDLDQNTICVTCKEDFGPKFDTNIKWMNSNIRFAPACYLNEEVDCKFENTIDIDFLGFAFQSLAFIKSKMDVVFVTELSKTKMSSSKILWQGKAVHNMLNTFLGQVDEFPVYVVFPNIGDRDPSEVIHDFFEQVVFEGILSSPAYRTSHVSWPYRACIAAEMKGATEPVLDVRYLQIALEEYLARNESIKPFFVIQQYGQKNALASIEKLEALNSKLSRLFDLTMVSKHKDGQKAMSYVDIASDISCTNDEYVTMFWNRNLYPMMIDDVDSPFAELMIPNSTIPMRARANRDFYSSPTIQEFPNFSIGSLASCVIEYKNESVLLRKIKLYQRGSQEFRHAVPFSNVWHALLSFPFEKVKSFISGAGTEITNAVLKRLRDEQVAITSRTEQLRAQTHYSIFMPQKAYGPRVELTLQNATGNQLLKAYELLKQFTSACDCTYNSLKAFRTTGLVPDEIMRCSPLQTVLTQTICCFPEMFTESISNVFYLLLDYIIEQRNSGIVEYNDHWVRLAFILQDLLTYIWTGSVQTLVFPKLFLRYELDVSVVKYGQYYISPQLLSFGKDVWDIKLHLPVNDALQETEFDEPIENLEVTDIEILPLPMRFLHTLLPQIPGSESDLQSFMDRIKLCMHVSVGVVKPVQKTNGWIIASNLVNGLFLSLFAILGIGDQVRMQSNFLDCLRGRSLLDVFDFVKRVSRNANTREQPGFLQYEDLVATAFPINVDIREFKECDQDNLPFKKMWHLARSKVIAEMNTNFKRTSKKMRTHEHHLLGYSGDVLTPDNLHAKMICLLKSLNLYFFPVLTKTYFWGHDNIFTFQRLGEVRSLPTVIRPDSKGRPISFRESERALLEPEMKIKLIDFVIFNTNACKDCKVKPELRSHCVFHATKDDPGAFMPYKAGLRDWIFATGLFQHCPKGKPIIPVPDAEWISIYRTHFPK